jgi:ribosomal protein S12 methylthiotransferase
MRTKSLKKNKINVITLGCSKNVYDSEVLMGQLRASGKDVTHEAPEAEEGNIIVINTCGFIDNAKAESVNMILEYADKKERGLVDKVFVTGCLSERYRPDLEKRFQM